MTLPNIFYFYAESKERAADTTRAKTKYKAVINGERVTVSWEKDVNIAAGGEVDYSLDTVERYFDNDEWTMIVEAISDPSLIKQLVSVAAAKCYAVTFFPDNAVVLQDMADESERVLNLKDVETALKWFDIKAQLDALGFQQ